MKNLIIIIGILMILVGMAPATQGESAGSRTTLEREARMAWWREARFGMFVHWGLYSGLAGTWQGKKVGDRGGMEWIQNRVRVDTDTYAEAAIERFKPTPDFARQWARLAKAAGCRYLVFTSKHHDGFALHDSAVSDYDAGSVLNRDLVKEIVEACRAEGLKVGFYHSVIDWHHDQYAYAQSKQLPHPLRGKPYPNSQRDHSRYVDYLHAQVDELILNYGPVDIMWWDYSSIDFQGQEAWRAFDLMDRVRAKQPQIIMNNRLFRIRAAGWGKMGTDGFVLQLDPKYGDFITPEQHIPDTGMPGLDWETCMTMNTTWGYSEHDHKWKTDETLIRNLVDIASKGGNYLLNIGPKGDGTIPEPSVQSLAAIGRWMKVNSASIYGTTASPFEKPAWGRHTKKADKLYAHVFEWPDNGKLTIPVTPGQVTQATLLADDQQKPLKLAAAGDSLDVHLPAKAPDPIASVIAIELKNLPATAKILYQDDFEGDRSNWVVEQMPGGSVRVSGGKLEIEDAKGCTVWFRNKLEGPIMIEYEALIIKQGGLHDRGSDLNCFWMAQDPKAYDNLFAGSRTRGGRFSNYDALRLYYVGYGANHNSTTRFRRYIGTGERPVLPEHDLSDEKYMLKYNVPIKIQLIADGQRIAYVRNGEVIYDVYDPEPYTDGWFGFRTVNNHMTIDNFKIYSLKK